MSFNNDCVECESVRNGHGPSLNPNQTNECIMCISRGIADIESWITTNDEHIFIPPHNIVIVPELTNEVQSSDEVITGSTDKVITGSTDKVITGSSDEVITGLTDKVITGLSDEVITGLSDEVVPGPSREVYVELLNMYAKLEEENRLLLKIILNQKG
jgi:hypothetical protein